jgi:hypothetical protein
MPTATPKAQETLRVVLPVCPVETCRRVGKIPVDHFGGKEFCAGRIDQSHKKVRMEKRTFELVDTGGDALTPSRPLNVKKQRSTNERNTHA